VRPTGTSARKIQTRRRPSLTHAGAIRLRVCGRHLAARQIIIDALKEIIGGRPADPQTMQRLMTCNLVEELDGTAY
jgi:uncharacterized protein HemY